MNWLVNWLIKELVIAVGALYDLLTHGIADFFNNPLIENLFTLFSWFGYVLYGIGALFAFLAFQEATTDGDIASLYDLGKGIILGFVTVVAIPYYLTLFTLSITISSMMVNDISSTMSNTDFSLVNELISTVTGGASSFLSLIIAIILFLASIILVWGTLKRVGEAVIYCFIMYLSVFGVTKCDYGLLTGTLTKSVGLLFVQVLHAPLYFAGMAYLFEGMNSGVSNLTEMTTSIIFFVMSVALPKVVDSTLQSSTSGRGGMMHTVNTAVMAMRSIK